MGEWFIRQKAAKSKLAQSKALRDLRSPGLLDPETEEVKIVFVTNEQRHDVDFVVGTPYLIALKAVGPAVLLAGFEEVGTFDPTETERARTYGTAHPHLGGLIPVTLIAIDPVDKSLRLTPINA